MLVYRAGLMRLTQVSLVLSALLFGARPFAAPAAPAAPAAAIVLKFAERGEIGLITLTDEKASYIDEHPPQSNPRKALGTIVLPGNAKIAFKSRDMMGIADLTKVLEMLPAQALTSLDLSNTLVSDADLKVVAKFRNLRRLDLENTDITDVGLKAIAHLSHLEALNLNKTKCNGAFLVELAGLKDLKFLRMGKSDLDPDQFHNLATFKKLVWLDIQQLHLHNQDMAVLKNFPDLQDLFIDDNTFLTDKMMPDLEGLKKLRSLSLKETAITVTGLSTIKKAPIHYLRVDEERFKKNDQEKLRKMFPAADLIVDKFRANAFKLYRELVE